MDRRGLELWLALVAIAFITAAYLFVAAVEGEAPGASSTFGHGLGILGFTLMLYTETGYSLRKHSHSARWGRLASWFEVHIFTGLVGPYLVLLHTSWKFNGVAGVLTLLTVVIVISGFVGRYIYTAIPRTADGAVLEKEEIEEQIRGIEAQLQACLAAYPPIPVSLYRRIESQPEADQGQPERGGLGRVIRERRKWLSRWVAQRRLSARERAQMRWLEQLIEQRDTLRRQVSSLAYRRRLLGYWHTFHIPLGLGMFVLAFVHIITAIYFSHPAP